MHELLSEHVNAAIGGVLRKIIVVGECWEVVRIEPLGIRLDGEDIRVFLNRAAAHAHGAKLSREE